MDGRRWRRSLIAVGCVALLLRILLIVATPHWAPIYDSVDFETHAAWISVGAGYPPAGGVTRPGSPSAFRPPAYPYLLGGVYAVFGVHLTIGRVVGAVLGTLTVLLTAWLGAGLWGRRVGLWAGIVAAICPSLIVLNGSLLSESLFLPLELGLALSLLALRRRGPTLSLALLAGVLCGLAALTRTVGIVFVIPTVWAIAAGAGGRPQRVKGVAVAALACIVVLAPWTIRNAETFHTFVPLDTEGGITLAGMYNSEANRDNSMEAIWRLFPVQTPDLNRQLAPVYSRPGGVNEAQLDSKLTSAAITYAANHPSYTGVVIGLDALRMFDIGKGHTWTTNRSLAEMDVPGGLRRVTTLALQLMTLIVLVGLIGRLTGLLQLPRLGPGVVWSIPLLALAGTAVATGTFRYGTILHPFIILLATMIVLSARFRSAPGRGRGDGVHHEPTRVHGSRLDAEPE